MSKVHPIYVGCHLCHASVGAPCKFGVSTGEYHDRRVRLADKGGYAGIGAGSGIDTEHALAHGAACTDDHGICSQCGQRIDRLQNIPTLLATTESSMSRADQLIQARLTESNKLTGTQLRQIKRIATQTRRERMGIEGDPDSQCHLWTHHLVKNLRAKGFKAHHLSGYAHPVPNGSMPSDGEIHHWAEVGDHVVDITADQFNYMGSNFPEVLVHPRATLKTHVPEVVVNRASFHLEPAPPGASDPRDSVHFKTREHPGWADREWEPVE